MAASLRDLLRRPTLRSLAGILSAQVSNNVVSLNVLVITARVLGPQRFGVLALAVSVAQLLSMVLDFGLSLTTVRIYNASSDRAEAERTIETIVRWKIVIVIALLGLGFPAARLLGVAFPALVEAQPLFYAAAVTAGLLSLWTSLLAIEQAKRNFRRYQRLIYWYAVLRIACCAVLFTTARSSTAGVFLALYTVPLVLLLSFTLRDRLGVTVAPFFRNVLRVDTSRLGTALSYGGWVAISSLSYAALSRLPQFALGRSAPEQLGLYSAGLTFLAAFSLMNDSLRTILIPEVASLSTGRARKDFRTKLWRWGPALVVLLSLTVVGVGFVQWKLLGPAYRDSLPVFGVLAVATAATIYLGMFNMLVHAHGIPSVDAKVNLGRLAVLTALLVVAPLNALWAALLFGAVLVLGEVVLYVIVLRRDTRVAV